MPNHAMDVEGSKRPELIKIAEKLETLPAPPDSVIRIFKMLGEKDSGVEDIVNLIKSELFVQTLRRIGIRQQDDFFRHSIVCAVCAGMIADKMSSNLKAMAFAGGLLHDAGKLIIQGCFPDEFRQVWSIHTEQEIPWLKAEQDVLGIDHTAAGRLLAKKWCLPDTVTETIELHHRPLDEIQGLEFIKQKEVVLAVNLADILAHEITADTMTSHRPDDDYRDILRFFDINPDDLEKIFSSLGKHYCDLASALDIKDNELSFYYQSLVRANKKLARIAVQNAKYHDLIKSYQNVTTENQEKDIEENQIDQKHNLVGAIAGGMAHDFNNILTAISGNVSLAKMYLRKDTEKAFEKLNQAETASRRAKDLTRQLLIFSKKGGTPMKRPASIAEIINNSIDLSLKDSNVRCEISMPDDLFLIEADQGQIIQVINNLIKNAEEAMQQGGLITLEAENITMGSKNNVPLRKGKYVKITVKDHGTGISKEDLPRIFDPYFTTKPKAKGLGLAIAYSIIKNHAGYIDLISELDIGTTFYIYLPASEEAE